MRKPVIIDYPEDRTLLKKEFGKIAATPGFSESVALAQELLHSIYSKRCKKHRLVKIMDQSAPVTFDIGKHYWPTLPDTEDQQKELDWVKNTRMDRTNLQWFMAMKEELVMKLARRPLYDSECRHMVNMSFALYCKIEEELKRLYSHDPEQRGKFIYGG